MAETQKTVTEPAAATADPAAKTETAAKTEAAAADPAAKAEQKTDSAAKTYDQAYIDSLMEQQKQAQEAAVAEALKVAGMDAEAKASYEKEQEAKKLAEREAEVARRELKADARGILAEKEIPAEFLDMLLGGNLKETTKNVETFKARFDSAVQAQVEKRLVGKTPQSGNGSELSEEAAIAAEIDKYL